MFGRHHLETPFSGPRDSDFPANPNFGAGPVIQLGLDLIMTITELWHLYHYTCFNPDAKSYLTQFTYTLMILVTHCFESKPVQQSHVWADRCQLSFHLNNKILKISNNWFANNGYRTSVGGELTTTTQKPQSLGFWNEAISFTNGDKQQKNRPVPDGFKGHTRAYYSPDRVSSSHNWRSAMLTSSIPNKSPYCVTNEQMTAKFGSPLQAEDSSLAMLGSYNDTELAASLHTKIFSNNKT